MIDQKTIALINQELDGQISAGDSARLHRHFETNPEARAYGDDLKRLTDMLSQVEQVEPPASLKVGILNAVRASARRVKSQPRILESILARLSSPAIPRYGFAFASGICLGVFIFAALTGGIDTGANEEQISGSMGTVVSTARIVTDYGQFKGPSTTSSVQVVSSGVQVFLEAEVQGKESSEFGLIFQPEAYAVVGIQRQGGSLVAVTAQNGSIVAAVAGSSRFVVELERIGESAPELRLELRQGGHILWDKALRTSPGE